MKPDPWLDWYCGKEGEVEEEIHELEHIFASNNVVKILDLGCGTGGHALHLTRRASSGGASTNPKDSMVLSPFSGC